MTALNGSNGTDTGYAGTVSFSASDTAATVPANHGLASGLGTFTATLGLAGSQILTALDVGMTATSGSTSVTVAGGAATHFAVSTPAMAIPHVAAVLTVVALDAFNNTAAAYGGSVHFTGGGTGATLPANQTMASGVGTFSATLVAVGTQTVTASDSVTATIAGHSAGITVAAGPCTHFSVPGPSTAMAGVAIAFTAIALDAGNNTATGYLGTVNFISSDNLATLPAAQTLTSGRGVFEATLVSQGSQNLFVSDQTTSSIYGSLFVTTGPGFAGAFVLTDSTGGTIGSNTAFSLTAQAVDAFGNLVTSYEGQATFDTSDSNQGNDFTNNVQFPFDATTGWVNGQYVINDINWVGGSLTVTFTCTDNDDSSITGTDTINFT